MPETDADLERLEALEALEAEFNTAGAGFVDLAHAIAGHKRAAARALAAGTDPTPHLVAAEAAGALVDVLLAELRARVPVIEAARRALAAG